jgi:hypothetical protein
MKRVTVVYDDPASSGRVTHKKVIKLPDTYDAFAQRVR